MNTIGVVLLIVAAVPLAPGTVPPHPEAKEVFRTQFDESCDHDYDGWPDHWTRRHGPGFPLFNKILLSEQSPPQGGRSLRLEVDGQGAAAFSPPLPLSPQYDYLLELDVQTDRVQNDRAFVSLTVLDAAGHAVQTFYSERLRECRQWTRLRLGPVSPDAPNAQSVLIGLHLEPTDRDDLGASAQFGAIWLARLPRLTLSTDQPAGIFTDPQRITITCTVSGLEERDAQAAFHVVDALGQRVAEGSARLIVAQKAFDSAASKPSLAPGGSQKPRSQTVAQPVPLQPAADPIWKAQWNPPIPGPGFYRVQAGIAGRSSEVLRREMTLAVIRAYSRSPQNEFGWSLAHPDRPLPPAAMANLLAEAGVNWVKCPLWLDSAKGDRQVLPLRALVDQLAEHRIEVVGVLDRPPEAIRAPLDPARTPFAAEIFTMDRSVWYPPVEWLMARLGGRIRWWQLGGDEDTSFVGYPALEAKLAQVKTELDRVGYDVNVGVGWDWLYPLPPSSPPKNPLRFVSLTAVPPLSAKELAAYLPLVAQASVRPWVVLEPLPRDEYATEVRIADLVLRMLEAKLRGAGAVFASDPFHPRCGLMNPDGSPSELFLPWRTTALLLGGSKPMGSIRLPQGSPNYLFARGEDALLIVWNPKPTRETLYLGEHVRQVDLWGREHRPTSTDAGQQLDVGPLPRLLTGLDKTVAQWRCLCTLAQHRMPSLLNQRHNNRIEFTNCFGHPVEGVVRVAPDEPWTVHPASFPFRLGIGERLGQDLQIILPSNATSGVHLLRFDFELKAERPYRFSVYAPIEVGLDNVEIRLVTQLNTRGELEVQQWVHNKGNLPVSLRCQLFAPGRQRLSTQVVGLPGTQQIHLYHLPEGRQLIGKPLWLQANQINGAQVLNYRFVAGQ